MTLCPLENSLSDSLVFLIFERLLQYPGICLRASSTWESSFRPRVMFPQFFLLLLDDDFYGGLSSF